MRFQREVREGEEERTVARMRESNGISIPKPSWTTSTVTLCALMERTLAPERTTWRDSFAKSAPTGAVTLVSQPGSPLLGAAGQRRGGGCHQGL